MLFSNGDALDYVDDQKQMQNQDAEQYRYYEIFSCP